MVAGQVLLNRACTARWKEYLGASRATTLHRSLTPQGKLLSDKLLYEDLPGELHKYEWYAYFREETEN